MTSESIEQPMKTRVVDSRLIVHNVSMLYCSLISEWKKRDIGLADTMAKKKHRTREGRVFQCTPAIPTLCSVFSKLHSVGIAGVHWNTRPSLVLCFFFAMVSANPISLFFHLLVYFLFY